MASHDTNEFEDPFWGMEWRDGAARSDVNGDLDEGHSLDAKYLTVKQGDGLFMQKQGQGAWSWVRDFRGREGWFPTDEFLPNERVVGPDDNPWKRIGAVECTPACRSKCLFRAVREHDCHELRKAGSFNRCLDERDKEGRTPLMLAVCLGSIELIDILLVNGADPNIVDYRGMAPIDVVLKGLRDIDEKRYCRLCRFELQYIRRNLERYAAMKSDALFRDRCPWV